MAENKKKDDDRELTPSIGAPEHTPDTDTDPHDLDGLDQDGDYDDTESEMSDAERDYRDEEFERGMRETASVEIRALLGPLWKDLERRLDSDNHTEFFDLASDWLRPNVEGGIEDEHGAWRTAEAAVAATKAVLECQRLLADVRCAAQALRLYTQCTIPHRYVRRRISHRTWRSVDALDAAIRKIEVPSAEHLLSRWRDGTIRHDTHRRLFHFFERCGLPDAEGWTDRILHALQKDHLADDFADFAMGDPKERKQFQRTYGKPWVEEIDQLFERRRPGRPPMSPGERRIVTIAKAVRAARERLAAGVAMWQRVRSRKTFDPGDEQIRDALRQQGYDRDEIMAILDTKTLPKAAYLLVSIRHSRRRPMTIGSVRSAASEGRNYLRNR